MASRPVKTVSLRRETWRKLQMLKLEMGFRSLDEVVTWLIEFYERRSGRGARGGEQSVGS